MTVNSLVGHAFGHQSAIQCVQNVRWLRLVNESRVFGFLTNEYATSCTRVEGCNPRHA